MPGSTERVMKAFRHERPDRTPLFEIFQPFQPIHWDICGRNAATDQAMYWDAMAGGISQDELIDLKAEAVFAIHKFFGTDMLEIPGDPPKSLGELAKTGEKSWRLDGIDYVVHERTQLVVPARPAELGSHSARYTEQEARRQVDEWDGKAPPASDRPFAVFGKVRELAEAEGLDWVWMAEIGAGTGVAFYPPFQLMWFVTEPELLARWIAMQTARILPRMKQYVEIGAAVVATGGDVSSDKGPFISPAHYRQFILPAIRQQVDFIHECGALAVYTSDGNHWPIRDEFFFHSGIDGYKEVDQAAGMTFERLIDEGVAERICIIGNMDARHLMCHASTEDVAEATRKCLELGRRSPGGHIIHLSHSVHEDVKVENYHAMIDAYRGFFGMEQLTR